MREAGCDQPSGWLGRGESGGGVATVSREDSERPRWGVQIPLSTGTVALKGALRRNRSRDAVRTASLRGWARGDRDRRQARGPSSWGQSEAG